MLETCWWLNWVCCREANLVAFCISSQRLWLKSVVQKSSNLKYWANTNTLVDKNQKRIELAEICTRAALIILLGVWVLCIAVSCWFSSPGSGPIQEHVCNQTNNGNCCLLIIFSLEKEIKKKILGTLTFLRTGFSHN